MNKEQGCTEVGDGGSSVRRWGCLYVGVKQVSCNAKNLFFSMLASDLLQ